MSLRDDLAPDYLGEDRIDLSLATSAPRAFAPVDIDVDYSRTLPDYVVLPLEMIVRAPSDANFERKYFRRVAPSVLSFTAKEGGKHLVLLRETAHNHWLGKIEIDVAGERLYPGNI